jgi:hypothetical protein
LLHFPTENTGYKKVPGLLLYPQAPIFMLIHICYTIINDDASETITMNFLQHSYRIRSTVLNLSSLQGTLSMIDGEKGTKILHCLFLDEELGLKNGPSITRDDTRS